jgi:hypothetical protein
MLKSAIQEKHDEVIGYNEQLKEQAIRQTQEDINRLTNFVFRCRTRSRTSMRSSILRRAGWKNCS